MDQNNKLFNTDGTKIIGDNALVAITIMIAESDPQEKDTMTKLIVNLISNPGFPPWLEGTQDCAFICTWNIPQPLAWFNPFS